MENQIVKVSQVSEIARIEIDSQIATARQYPRDIKKIIQTVKDLCTINDEIASSCFYAKPVGAKEIDKKNKKSIINQTPDQLDTDKIVVGESVHFAKIVASEWEHLKIRTYIKEENDKAVIAVCQIHDQQKNMAYESEVHRSIVTKYGKQSQSQIEVTKMAAQAIAYRNAVLSVIPKAYFIDTLEYIKKFSVGLTEKQKETKDNTFETAKNKALTYFKKAGVTEDQICAVLEVGTIDQINANHLIALRGFVTAIMEKTDTLDNIFNPKKENEPAQSTITFEKTESGKIVLSEEFFKSIKKGLNIPSEFLNSLKKLQKTEPTEAQKSEITELVFSILKKEPDNAVVIAACDLYELPGDYIQYLIPTGNGTAE